MLDLSFQRQEKRTISPNVAGKTLALSWLKLKSNRTNDRYKIKRNTKVCYLMYMYVGLNINSFDNLTWDRIEDTFHLFKQ